MTEDNPNEAQVTDLLHTRKPESGAPPERPPGGHGVSLAEPGPILLEPAYIDYLRAKEILKRGFPDTSEEEISLWLQNKELTAFTDENIYAAVANFSKKFENALINFSLYGGTLPTCYDLLNQCYFSESALESFEPKTRWRPYDYIVDIVKTYHVDKDDLNAMIRRDWERCLIYDDHTPRYYAEDFAQATGQNIQEHYYPSYWIDELIRDDLEPYWTELTKDANMTELTQAPTRSDLPKRKNGEACGYD